MKFKPEWNYSLTLSLSFIIVAVILNLNCNFFKCFKNQKAVNSPFQQKQKKVYHNKKKKSPAFINLKYTRLSHDPLNFHIVVTYVSIY